LLNLQEGHETGRQPADVVECKKILQAWDKENIKKTSREKAWTYVPAVLNEHLKQKTGFSSRYEGESRKRTSSGLSSGEGSDSVILVWGKGKRRQRTNRCENCIGKVRSSNIRSRIYKKQAENQNGGRKKGGNKNQPSGRAQQKNGVGKERSRKDGGGYPAVVMPVS